MSIQLSLQMTAKDVRGALASPEEFHANIRWLAERGINNVYIGVAEWDADHAFWSASAEDIESIRSAFQQNGISTFGRINPVHLTRPSNGWPETPCPSDPCLNENLKSVLVPTLKHFDRIIIDNRLFFDCTCEACDLRRHGRTWTQFHCDELNRVLRQWVIEFAASENPQARIIWKFPSWHEMVRTRGYDVIHQTQIFPEICAGVETRDPEAWERWGGRQPYGAYCTASYFRAANPQKCHIAWFDSFACDEIVYAAQAWGAALAGMGELTLYDYGSLFDALELGDYPAMKGMVENLCAQWEGLQQLSTLVAQHPPRGILACRPPDGDAQHEPYFYDYLGMLGLPLICVHDWRGDESLPFALGLAAAADPQLKEKIVGCLLAGNPMLLSSRLVETLGLNDLPAHAHVMDTHSVRFTERMWRFADQAIEDNIALPRADTWFQRDVTVLEELRRPFYEALGLPMMKLPARVGVFPLGERYMALADYSKQSPPIDPPGKLLVRILADEIPGHGSLSVYERPIAQMEIS